MKFYNLIPKVGLINKISIINDLGSKNKTNPESSNTDFSP